MQDTTSTSPAAVPEPGIVLSALTGRYDALFCDIWGVVHNGVSGHPGAIDALVRFREQGGHVILVSNASRPGDVIGLMLDRMHIPRTAYDRIVTSGDATRSLVNAFSGQTVHHVGPHTDNPMFEGVDVDKGDADAAAAIVITGLDQGKDNPADYGDQLRDWRARDLPLICANPDHVVEIGNTIEYCAGAIADVYERMGGEVRMAGKPFAPIYQTALARLEEATGRPVDKTKLLAIGDSVRTDAMGAAGLGVDFLFITGSIHAGDIDAFGTPDPKAIADLVAPSGAGLIGFAPRLVW